MFLHENKHLFEELITAASKKYYYKRAFIEKDYFATLFLAKAVTVVPGLTFKGGTALSKCYKVIDRFSEDIDLTLDTEHFTQGKKRQSIKNLIFTCEELKLTLLNREEIEHHAHSNYNRYEIKYPKIFISDNVDSRLNVEMTFIQKTYPTENGKVVSYIGEFLLGIGDKTTVDEYGLRSFDIQVQTLERTLVDKVFALCDYYLANKPRRNSRHIYDIYKILMNIDIHDPNLRGLIINVREERKRNKTCFSAQENVDINKVLKEIIASKYYKEDYQIITMTLLREYVSYEEAIKSLATIMNERLF